MWDWTAPVDGWMSQQLIICCDIFLIPLPPPPPPPPISYGIHSFIHSFILPWDLKLVSVHSFILSLGPKIGICSFILACYESLSVDLVSKYFEILKFFHISL
jgi:hypothetical protein